MPRIATKSRMGSLVAAYNLLLNKDFDLFLCLLSRHIPDWIFKYNSGTIVHTNSPKVLVRDYHKYVYRRADTADLNGISQLSGLPIKDISRRLADGDWCYVIEDISNGNPIKAVSWVHIGNCYIRGFGLDLKLDEQSAYLFGAYSSPSVRFTGVFNSLLNKVINDLKSQNINSFCGLIERRNVLAYQYHLRLNFKPVAFVKYIKMFPLRLSIWTDLNDHKKQIRICFNKPKAYI